MIVGICFRRASMVCHRFSAWCIDPSNPSILISCQCHSMGWHCRKNGQQHTCCPIRKISVNEVSTILGSQLRIIKQLCNRSYPYSNYCLPYEAKRHATPSPPLSIIECPWSVICALTECQQSVNWVSTEHQESINRASTERPKTVNRASLQHQWSVNRVSTERPQSINRASTERQQSVQKESKECHYSVNEASTEREQSINKESTQHQQSVNSASTECQQSINRVSMECEQFLVLQCE